MATQKRSATTRGRLVHKQTRQRQWLVIGFVAFIIVILIGSVAMIGRQASQAGSATSQPLNVSSSSVPANAEPNGQAWGPKDAPITVIEYADYECESCGYFARTYEQEFTETFAPTGNVRFEIRNAPFHGAGSRNAAQAAYCAAEQDKFWPMHDSLFLNQPVHGAPASENFNPTMLNALAGKVGLNTGVFGQCLSSGKYTQQVEQDYQNTIKNNITGTPTFVVNGQLFTGPKSTAEFRQIFAQVAPSVPFDKK